MRILTEELKRYENDPNSVFYKITHTPKPDFTELNRICDEVRETLKIEREKEKKLIIETRKKDEA